MGPDPASDRKIMPHESEMMMREGRKVGRKQGDKRKVIGEKGEEEVGKKRREQEGRT